MSDTTTSYMGRSGEVHIDFEPTGHTYGIGTSPDNLHEVPAFSDLSDYLPKYLASWAQNCGVGGTLAVLDRATVRRLTNGEAIIDLNRIPTDDRKFVLDLIKNLGMDHDSIREAAAERGTMVHNAYRGFVVNGFLPDPDDYAVGEAKGYIASLRMFCEAIKGNFETILCEEPIASLTMGIAGTPDHFVDLKTSRVQTGGTVGKRPKFEDVSGRCLVDLKTSKSIFPSHKWQLATYHHVLHECGFEYPEKRVIVQIKPNSGGYAWKEQELLPLDAIHALVRVWEAENRPEGWLM